MPVNCGSLLRSSMPDQLLGGAVDSAHQRHAAEHGVEGALHEAPRAGLDEDAHDQITASTSDQPMM